MTEYAAEHMPARAPLTMRAQRFANAPDPSQRPIARHVAHSLWRAAAFVPTVALTGLLCLSMARYFSGGGVSVLEGCVLALITVCVVWLAFSVNTACLGLVRIALGNRAEHNAQAAPLESVALLMPVYNETPWDVFGNASAMLREVTARGQTRFSLFILSDTRDPAIARLEERAFQALRREHAPRAAIHYRRRLENTDKKVGNIADWIENWGAAYEAMVVLDADSLMSGAAIRQLVQALAADPGAGLIQSRPQLIGAHTLFGRAQQFSNSVYGWLVAEGLASWSQSEGNYWGHNAIIRTRAFAESARLPHLEGRSGAKTLLLSHDFVEAGLLRRAGWTVRLLPGQTGSFEETPQNLIDFALRDQRWCQGNLQHLRILAADGFHIISRFHLLHGALSFLMSPAWLAVIVLWAFVGVSPTVPESYFSPANPLMPIWPETGLDAAWVFLAFVYGMLLFPKLAGALVFGLQRRTRAAYRSGWTYLGSIGVEVFLSVLFAPIMMVQHTRATLKALTGRTTGWAPQNRNGAEHSWGTTLRFHWVETVMGLCLLAGMAVGTISVLILPIAFSLAAAVPLSKLSGWRVGARAPRALRLETPHEIIEPKVVALARNERARLKSLLAEPQAPSSIAAE